MFKYILHYQYNSKMDSENKNPITNQKTIVTSFKNRVQFLNLLKNNPGMIIIKFGAEWCGPCKTIRDTVYNNFKEMPENVICADINITHNFDVYTFLKSNTGIVTWSILSKAISLSLIFLLSESFDLLLK